MQSIKDWAASGSVKNILQSLGSANFYRHFIDGFSKVARPLMALTAFNWTEAARSALVTSKHLLPWRPFGRPRVLSGGMSLKEIQASRRELGAFCYLKGPDRTASVSVRAPRRCVI
jgi:hypothetical protein